MSASESLNQLSTSFQDFLSALDTESQEENPSDYMSLTDEQIAKYLIAHAPALADALIGRKKSLINKELDSFLRRFNKQQGCTRP